MSFGRNATIRTPASRCYVNTSGPGPAIAALPIFAASQFWQGKLAIPRQPVVTGKVRRQALFVAASASLLI